MIKTRRAGIIVLLADGFDEAAVGVILTTLRQHGLAVKLVALRSKPVNGSHGLSIVPDSSLDRILEGGLPILALILPEGSGHLARLRMDPRVGHLIQRSIVSGAALVGFGEQASRMVTDVAEIEGKVVEVIQPEAGMYLEDFAGTVSQALLGGITR